MIETRKTVHNSLCDQNRHNSINYFDTVHGLGSMDAQMHVQFYCISDLHRDLT